MKKPGELYHQSLKVLYNKIDTPDTFKNKEIIIPSTWQNIALKFGRSIRYLIYRTPGGCGKTFLALLISIDETIKTQNTRKHLFITPTIDIGENFCNFQEKQIKVFYENIERIWEVPQEHKFNSSDSNSIKELKKFLLSNTNGYAFNEMHLKGQYATATHMGFNKIWEKLTKKEKRNALRNLTLHIDKCHHSKTTPLDSTQLGTFVRDVCNIDEPTCNINLYTATLYRTDKGSIIPRSFESRFKIWDIPLEHYLSIIGIKEFNFQFTHYKKDPLDQIIEYMQQHKSQKHIVILPADKNRFRNKNTLQKYIKNSQKIFDSSRILDLITTKTQEKNRALLKKNHRGYDVVIACKIFYEGYDWPPASVLHYTNYNESQVIFTQTMFRVFRKYPDKEKIWLYIYIPPLENKKGIRALYSDRLNLFLTSIIISEFCSTIKIPMKPTAPFYKDKQGSTNLFEILSHDIYTDLKKIIITAYDYNIKKDSPDEIRSLLEVISEDFYKYVKKDITAENFTMAVKALFLRIVRLSINKSIDHISIDFIRKEGFDKIWEIEQIGSIVLGTKQPLTQTDLYELRDIMEETLLINIKKDGLRIQQALTQDHKVNKIAIQNPIQTIKNMIGQWVVFDIPKGKKITPSISETYSDHAKVIEQEGSKLKVALYKGNIIIENEKIVLVVNPGLIRKDREEKFIYCTNYWRSTYMVSTVTPSNTKLKNTQKYFLFEGNIFPGRMKAPYIIRKIPYEWIRYTL